MKLSVLALDYDGTMACDGRAHPAVIDAIRTVRSRGIAVVLVTWRRLADLQRPLKGKVVFGGDEEPPRLSEVARALRRPDTSIVIDLSSVAHEAKLAYAGGLLPMLAALRRDMGLPHWIVVDEAHYFLSGPEAERMVDFELAAYLLITYRPSLLHPRLLETVETVLATPLTDPGEVHALSRLCEATGSEVAWGKCWQVLALTKPLAFRARPHMAVCHGASPSRYA